MNKAKANTKRIWDACGEAFDRFTTAEDSYSDNIERPAIEQLIGDLRGARALDLGCGSGTYSTWLAERGAQVIGLDLSSTMVSLARERTRKQAIELEICVADISKPLPFDESQFDLVFTSTALHYVEDIGSAIKEAARVMKPGAQLLASVLHPMSTSRFPVERSDRSIKLDSWESRHAWEAQYFGSPARAIETPWLGFGDVSNEGRLIACHHHTTADYFSAISSAGLTVTAINSRKNSAPLLYLPSQETRFYNSYDRHRMAPGLHLINREGVMIGRRATIIYNPMSGRPARRAEDVREMARLLEQREISVEARATTGPDDATRLAREAVAAGVDIIIGYGGDGTLNEIIQGMVGSRAALAVWPGGTSNVVAHDLEMPFNIGQLADVIAKGKTKRIALGLASSEARREKIESESGRNSERFFFMMAGIGLDASIARSVNKNLKRRTGEFAYWVTGLKHLFTWQAETFVIEVDGKTYESAFALIGNGKGYGGGICITPHAQLEEPWFEVYILPPQANKLAYLRVLAACMRGQPESTNATLVTGRRIKANSSNEPWVEADGELIGPLPMSFDIVPDALSIIVP